MTLSVRTLQHRPLSCSDEIGRSSKRLRRDLLAWLGTDGIAAIEQRRSK